MVQRYNTSDYTIVITIVILIFSVDQRGAIHFSEKVDSAITYYVGVITVLYFLLLARYVPNVAKEEYMRSV